MDHERINPCRLRLSTAARLHRWHLVAVILASLAALLAGPAEVHAHELGALKVSITPAAGALAIDIDVHTDHLPFVLRPADLSRSPSQLIDRLFESFDLRVGAVPTTLELLEVQTQSQAADDAPDFTTFTLRCSAAADASASTYTWNCTLPLGQYLLVINSPGQPDPQVHWVEGKEPSAPFPLATSSKGEPSRDPLVDTDNHDRSSVFVTYTKLGFTHIIPKGLDHILFVLGLFLLSLRVKPLLSQITAFTIAHSVTLLLSIFGIVSIPSSIVEPLIALSIAYVAIENIFLARSTTHRTVVVFCFGLLHGMGFAGVLTELGLPRQEFISALISFNVGVELGQLAVLLGAFLTVGLWFGRKSWYRSRITIPASVAIAAVGLYWTIERVTESF